MKRSSSGGGGDGYGRRVVVGVGQRERHRRHGLPARTTLGRPSASQYRDVAQSDPFEVERLVDGLLGGEADGEVLPRALLPCSKRSRGREHSLEEGGGRRFLIRAISTMSRPMDDSLFDRDALGQVPRLVHVAAAQVGDVISQELERNDVEDRRRGTPETVGTSSTWSAPARACRPRSRPR